MGRIAYVNKDDCTSCNQCADNLPKYFQMDDNDNSEPNQTQAASNVSLKS